MLVIQYCCDYARLYTVFFFPRDQFFQWKVFELLYLSLYQAVCQCGIITWGGLTENNLKPLKLQQNKIIIICLNKLSLVGSEIDMALKFLYEDIINSVILVFRLKQNKKYNAHHASRMPSSHISKGAAGRPSQYTLTRVVRLQGGADECALKDHKIHSQQCYALRIRADENTLVYDLKRSRISVHFIGIPIWCRSFGSADAAGQHSGLYSHDATS